MEQGVAETRLLSKLLLLNRLSIKVAKMRTPAVQPPAHTTAGGRPVCTRILSYDNDWLQVVYNGGFTDLMAL